jgi:hypothetical protein
MKRAVSFLVILISGLVLLFTSLEAAGIALAAGGTPTPTPTRTAVPTQKPASGSKLTPTPTPVTGKLKSQLFFGGFFFAPVNIGEAVPGCPKYSKISDSPELPFVRNAGRQGEYGQVCIYGLQLEGPLQVNLTRPDGKNGTSAQLHLEDLGFDQFTVMQDDPELPQEVGYAGISEGIPVMSLRMWWPAGLPVGKWLIDLSGPNDEVSGKFKVDDYPPQPSIGLVKPKVGAYSANTSPFTRPKGQENPCPSVSPGQTFTVYAVNLNPETKFKVGLYQVKLNLSAELVREYSFKTNKKGNQRVEMQPPASDPTGRYYPVLILNTNTTSLTEAGPTACYELVSSSGTLPGMQVQIEKLNPDIQLLFATPAP